MEIRHAVRENRLSDPNLVTSADCAAFIEPSDIWVWIEDDPVRAFAAGDTRNGWIWALLPTRAMKGAASAWRFCRLPVKPCATAATPARP